MLILSFVIGRICQEGAGWRNLQEVGKRDSGRERKKRREFWVSENMALNIFDSDEGT